MATGRSDAVVPNRRAGAGAVARGGPPALRPDPREVVKVFDVALSELFAPGVHHAERWQTPLGQIEVHFFDLADETVWGATARILYGFLRHLVGDDAQPAASPPPIGE